MMEQVKALNTGQFAKGNKGKPKGAIHKTTKSAKDAIALAADMLGGVDRLVAWARSDDVNERVFWGTIYPKLLPLQVNGSNEDGSHSFTFKWQSET